MSLLCAVQIAANYFHLDAARNKLVWVQANSGSGRARLRASHSMQGDNESKATDSKSTTENPIRCAPERENAAADQLVPRLLAEAEALQNSV